MKEKLGSFAHSNDQPLLSIILPSLNEELSIQKVIEEIQSIKLPKNEIIVVDGCSTDSTIKIVKKFKIKILIEPKRGYGNAILKGVNAANGKLIVTMDSDYTYPASYIPYLIAPLMKNKAHLVLGNRLRNKRTVLMKKSHLFGNWVLTIWFNLMHISKFKDTQTGFRAFPKKLFKQLNVKNKGIFFPTEFLIRAVKNRLKIIEVPISYRNRIGKSKLSPIRDGIMIFVKILISAIL